MRSTSPENAVAATDPIIHLLGPSWLDVRPRASTEEARIAGASLLACRPVRAVLLHEAAIGEGIPPRPDRRRLYDEVARGVEAEVVVVFTDPAHSAYAWCWRSTRSGGIRRYLDIRVPPRTATLLRALRAEDDGDSGGAPVDGEASRGVVMRLTSTLVDGSLQPTTDLRALIDWIDGCEEPESLRSLWRLLRSFVAVERDCEDGAGLVTAARSLEQVYHACLDRMRSWVDDSAAEAPKRRPEYLSDFRREVEAHENGSRSGHSAVYVRRLIAQRNLCGLAMTPGAARASRARLLSYIGDEGTGVPILDVNVQLDPRSAPRRWRSPPEDSPARRTAACPDSFRDARRPPSASSTDVGEREELLRRTFEILRDVRLKEDSVSNDLRRAAVQLERRRRALMHDLVWPAAADRDPPLTARDLQRVFLLNHRSTVHVLGEAP